MNCPHLVILSSTRWWPHLYHAWWSFPPSLLTKTASDWAQSLANAQYVVLLVILWSRIDKKMVSGAIWKKIMFETHPNNIRVQQMQKYVQVNTRTLWYKQLFLEMQKRKAMLDMPGNCMITQHFKKKIYLWECLFLAAACDKKMEFELELAASFGIL